MVVFETVSADQLQEAQKAYEEEVRLSGKASTTVQFQYAYCLVYSERKEDIPEGLKLLQGLCRPGTDQRDYFYFLAFGKFRLEEYQAASQFVKHVLTIEPNNRQAKALDEAIHEKLKSEGLKGMAIVGGVAAVAAGLFFLARR